MAFGFVLKDEKNGSCRHFCPNENKALLERAKLVARKDDLKKIETLLNNVDMIESCTREQANILWKFYKLMNATFFSALVMEVLMGYKNAVLPEPLIRNGSVKRLTFEKSTRKPYIDNFASSEL